MFVKRAWYAAAWAHELGEKPMYRQLLGQHVALYRDDKGVPRALSALCPHRGANLGAGRVVDGVLQCPFHGWQFNDIGRCVRIPSQTADTPISERAVVPVYPLQEHQGVLYIWMDPALAPKHGPKTYDFLEASSPVDRYYCKPRLYEASFLNVVENAIDNSHLAFVHKTSIGANQDPTDPISTISLDKDGFSLRIDHANQPRGGPRRRSFARRVLRRITGSGEAQSTHLRFDLGGFVIVDDTLKDGSRTVAYAWTTPKDEGSTWFFAGATRRLSLNPIAKWLSRKIFDILVDEDGTAMKLILPVAKGSGGLPHPVFVRSDKQTLAFRRLFGDALRAEGHETVPWAEGEAIHMSWMMAREAAE